MSPPAPRIALRSHRVVTGDTIRPATILVEDGKIVAVQSIRDLPEGYELQDVGDTAILPGLVDTHVHANDPGRSDWEGFDTATRAAAAGGITTIVDMPLNSLPVTTHRAALHEKLVATVGRRHVDCGFWGGAVPNNTEDLPGLLDGGARGLKAFLVDSGIDEFPRVSEGELRPAMEMLAARGAPLLVHAEVLDPPTPSLPTEADPRQYATYLATRPHSSEIRAIQWMIRLCRETGCHVHIVHLSSAQALEPIAEALSEGVPLTIETCPHYLFFAAEEIPAGRTDFKCAPPIRETANREALWQGLIDGTIQSIASDHSPSPPERKLLEQGDFLAAWGGISSLQLSLPAVWTRARERGADLPDLVRWMATVPAHLAGLAERKGSIAVGQDADLIAFDPDAAFTVEPERLQHRHPLTPYGGETLQGIVEKTWLRGRLIHDAVRKDPFPTSSTGRVLLAESASRQQVETLNLASEDEAREALQRCCGASRWATRMLARRPFRNREQLLAAATEMWRELTPDDWLEAFRHHPRIGDLESLRKRFASTRAWAGDEQAGTASASEEVLHGLADGNRDYEKRFGYIFIVCATGKSAEEMLTILCQRLENRPDEELHVAAAEQAKITEIRLEKLLSI